MKAFKIDKDQLRHKVVSFSLTETKEIEEGGVKYGVIKGYASTYGNIDRGGDRIEEGAFTNSIARHRVNDRPIRMLYQHDRKQLIGGYPIDKIVDDAKGLYVEGHINLEVQKGAEAYALAKQGVLSDLSIGYSVVVYEFDEKTEVITLKEVELWEVSPVSEPMNAQANILEVKNKLSTELNEVDNIKDVEMLLKDLTNLSGNQRKILISKIKSFSRDAESANETAKNRDDFEAKLDNHEIKQKLDLINKLLKGGDNA